MKRKWIWCGIFSSLLYIVMNVFVPMLYDGYSYLSQTVSELSAIGAPTRTVWVLLGLLYGGLVIAFGSGVWRSAGANRDLRVAGSLLTTQGALSLYWPPMHLRGTETTLTDSLHIVWTIATVILMMLAIVFGAAALGKRFRLYSIVTLVILVATGALTGIDGPRIAANLPTPWVGLWERLSIAAYMVWVIVFSISLLREPAQRRWGGRVRRRESLALLETHVGADRS